MGFVGKEISFDEFRRVVKEYFKYIFSKWSKIFAVSILFFASGIIYAWLQKPIYTAELTFASETEKSSSLEAYVGIAAQFGLNMTNGGGLFEGDNLIELLKSRLLIEKTLLTPVRIGARDSLLINYYISLNRMDKDWKKNKNPAIRNIIFRADEKHGDRIKDSIMKNISKDVNNSLVIEKLDKKLNIISAKAKSNDELFAKLFIETLTNNAIQYYVDYKSKKSRQNVEILQKQTDSVRILMSGSIEAIAESNDLNINPLRQVARTHVQKKQIDMQASSQMYGELLKQLELSKLVLRRETPLIQIIDTPILPLEKKKLGRLMGGLIFGFIGGFLAVAFFACKKFFQS